MSTPPGSGQASIRGRIQQARKGRVWDHAFAVVTALGHVFATGGPSSFPFDRRRFERKFGDLKLKIETNAGGQFGHLDEIKVWAQDCLVFSAYETDLSKEKWGDQALRIIPNKPSRPPVLIEGFIPGPWQAWLNLRKIRAFDRQWAKAEEKARQPGRSPSSLPAADPKAFGL